MKTTKTRFLVCFLALVLIGCKDQSTNSISPDPYTRWQSHNFHNYTIDQVRGCFCVYGGEKMRITVRSDTVAQVVRISDGSVLTPPASSWYPTVDSLFRIIRNPGKDSLVIEYDANYGYPTKLDINPQQHPVDGGALIESSNLQIP